ncbi:tRNA (adenosine(37)-N6)-threonylcarbamoyltransferase complex dimerization subunit type 1 TsaB [Gemmobacter sp.]|uniref:tRNA (adenosine(37)-N6)-threonylcarbamoyltransferase complex dimerization subunit type 1 TsaB n=1 Tax=Gemmobacter sp. TaxID=1898957 RepID=UPI002B000EF7|nr:tRNA (adenosine(37)-N6)-threonylcarbamoyltransferase complex dimerization subunit type 1 TsaB [Gemmobacter sp.]
MARGPCLAFDTSAAHCAAAVVMDGMVRVARLEPMARGQAERLMPLLEEVLAEAGAGWADLAGLAVGIGPGNFTGVRISVAAARGLALGLRVPVVGISGFELLLRPGDTGPLLLCLPAPRDQVYVQAFRDGRPVDPPRLIYPAVPGGLALAGATVRGHGAEQIARALGIRAEPADTSDFPRLLGARAAWRLAQPPDGTRPAPLYVRPPDAAPPSDPPPVILDA